MTGFARVEGRHGEHAWTWEARSVNGRNLDVRLRLPNGSDHLEAPARAQVADRLKRGSVTVVLTTTRPPGATRLVVNRDALEQALALLAELAGRIEAAPPRLDGLLAIRGVVEAVDEEEAPDAREAREAAMVRSLAVAVDALVRARGEEGRRLAAILDARLADLERLAAAAEGTASMQPAAILARLTAQLDALRSVVPEVAPERLASEAALLVAKADIREELDRLKAHLAAARELIASGDAVGRRLDFLCQELNREANTLCSKSADLALTRIGLDLKASIEQLREQIQNVE